MAQAKNTANKVFDIELQKTLFLIVVSLVILLLIIYLAFLPVLKQSLNLTKQIKEKKTDLSKVQISKEGLTRLEEEVTSLNNRIVISNERLFWDKDNSRFLDKLTQLAVDLPIEFVTLKPEAAVVSGKKDAEDANAPQLTRIPFTVTLRANYNNLVEFLERIETSEKYIRINTLSIESNTEDMNKHNFTIELNIFTKEAG